MMMQSKLTMALAALTAPALIAGATLSGCAPVNDRTRAQQQLAERQPSIEVTSGTRELFTGEVVSFGFLSNNVAGLDANVEWTTTGGQIITEDRGRIARARFDQPGAYTVTAILFVDGREVDRDSATVNVRPLR